MSMKSTTPTGTGHLLPCFGSSFLCEADFSCVVRERFGRKFSCCTGKRAIFSSARSFSFNSLGRSLRPAANRLAGRRNGKGSERLAGGSRGKTTKGTDDSGVSSKDQPC